MPKQVKQATRPVAKPPKAEAKPVAKTEKPKVIQLLVKQNPKRGQSRNRFALYRNGMTTDAYVQKCEAAGFHCGRADLAWDETHKFIAIK